MTATITEGYTHQLDALPSPDSYDIMEMSNETLEWLRTHVKVGFTTERGPAWWSNATTKAGQWTMPEGSHFPGPVPIEAVKELLDVTFVKGEVHVTYIDGDGHRQVASDADTAPIVNRDTGEIFSYPTKGYKIHPYLDTLHDFIAAVQFDTAVAVGSVGLLKQGGQAFLQARLPEEFEIAGFGYAPYFMGTTSVDGSRKTNFTTGMLAGVCDNTVNRALSEALTQLKVSHRSEMPPVQFVRDTMGLQLKQAGKAIGEQIEALLSVKVSKPQFEKWLGVIQPKVKPNPKYKTGGQAYTNAQAKRAEYRRLWAKDPKVAPWAGTAFGILQLDNTYRTWEGRVTGTGGRIEQNFSRLVRGATADADAKALAILAEVIG